jgi:ribosome-associated translation inhibitor RaiA
MQIQINTDHHIKGHEALETHVRHVVNGALGRFSESITRLEVHVSDENAGKGGQHDKRCLMEARLEGLRPLAVHFQAATVGQAVDGAVDKLSRLLDSTLGRLRDHRSHGTKAALREPTSPDEE